VCNNPISAEDRINTFPYEIKTKTYISTLVRTRVSWISLTECIYYAHTYLIGALWLSLSVFVIRYRHNYDSICKIISPVFCLLLNNPAYGNSINTPNDIRTAKVSRCSVHRMISYMYMSNRTVFLY
jgi:hypothetical protein